MAQVFKLSDGSKVEYPDGPLTPEEKAWLRESGGMPAANVVLDVIKSAKSGLTEGALRAPMVLNDLSALATAGFDKVFQGIRDQSKRPVTSDDLLWALQEVPNDGAKLMRAIGLDKLADREQRIYDSYQTEGMLHTPETKAGRYVNSGANAVGGMVLGSTNALKGPVALTAAKSLPAAVGRGVMSSPIPAAAGVGVAGEFAGDVSRGFDETKDQSMLARFLGGAAPAILTALKRKLTQPPAARVLHEAGKDLTPADFEKMKQETARLEAAGTTQNTVGDAAGANGRYAALEREASNELGAGPLAAKIAGRAQGDIPRLETVNREAINAKLVPGGTPINRYPTQQENLLQQARSNRSAAVNAAEKGAPLVSTQDLAQVVKALRERQFQRGNRQTVDADFASQTARTLAGGYRYPLPGAANAAPRGAVPTPVTPLNGADLPPAIPGAVVPLSAQSGQLPPPARSAVAVPELPQGGPLGPRVFNAEDFEGIVPPASGYRPTGAPPDITDVTSRTMPPRIPKGFDVEELSKRLQSLNTMQPKGAVARDNMTGAGKEVDFARNAALGIARKELGVVSPAYAKGQQIYKEMSPGVDALKVLAGNPTVLKATPNLSQSPARESLQKYLTDADAALAQAVSERIRAGDVLSRNTGQAGVQGVRQELSQNPLSQLVAPVSSANRAFSGKAARTGYEQIGNLFANPTPANIDQLRKLAETNPDVARRMRDLGLLGAVNATTQTEGSQP